MSKENTNHIKDLLFEANRSLAGLQNKRYLAGVVLLLTRLLKVRYAFIGTNKNNIEIDALYFSDRQNIKEPFTYSREKLPCDKVLEGNTVSVPCHLSEKYSKVKDIESYIGVPIKDASSNIIGLIAVEGEEEIADPETVIDLLQLLVDRIAVELQYSHSVK